MNKSIAIVPLLLSCALLTFYVLVNSGAGRAAEITDVRTGNTSPHSPENLRFVYPKDSDSRLKKKWQVPFELLRNKIILPVRVNDSRELKVILDTGKPSPGLTLFDRDLGDELKLKGTRKLRVSGAGKGQVSYGMVVKSTKLSLAGLDIENQRVVILQSGAMQGGSADGVIGYTLFGSYVVKIDYDKKTIILIDSLDFEPDPTWKVIPLTFNEKKIPFLDAVVSTKGDKEISVSLYIDLSSSEALVLLVKPDMKFTLPRNLWGRYSGRGMDGYIFGKFGYVTSLKIGSYVLRYVATAFPKSEVRSRQQGADGILCNNALRRFNVIFDYSRARLYLKPNSYFSVPFY